MALLEVRNLTTTFRTGGGTITPVDDISFHVMPREVLGLVGESGSGKSVALDMLESCPITGSDSRVIGGSDLIEPDRLPRGHR